MNEVLNNLLPLCVQNLFNIRETQYDLSGTGLFKKYIVRTNTKRISISAMAVTLCDSCDSELKRYSLFFAFKNMFKNKVLFKQRKANLFVKHSLNTR